MAPDVNPAAADPSAVGTTPTTTLQPPPADAEPAAGESADGD